MDLILAQRTTFEFDAPSDMITLDETARHRRRVKMTSDHGITFLLDLSEAKLLRHGEGLVLDDGRIIEVCAEPEALYEVKAKDEHHLLTLAWQLGNRHLQAQIFKTHLVIRSDHVIKNMLEGLGALVTEISAPFDPETGAYSGNKPHAHSHDHSHVHSNDHHHE
jgi:urease accessory protein